jgi:hypothetical protein
MLSTPGRETGCAEIAHRARHKLGPRELFHGGGSRLKQVLLTLIRVFRARGNRLKLKGSVIWLVVPAAPRLAREDAPDPCLHDSIIFVRLLATSLSKNKESGHSETDFHFGHKPAALTLAAIGTALFVVAKFTRDLYFDNVALPPRAKVLRT